MLFCDKRTTCEESADYLRGLLGKELEHKNLWFHTGCSEEHRVQVIDDLKAGRVCCRDGEPTSQSDIIRPSQWTQSDAKVQETHEGTGGQFRRARLDVKLRL